MNPERTPLVSKLILLVLSLIFVCLVLLVIRAYEQGVTPVESVAVAVETPLAEEAPAPVEPPVPVPKPVVKRPVAAVAPRMALAVRAPAEAPDASPSTDEPPPSSVIQVLPVPLPVGLVVRSGDGTSVASGGAVAGNGTSEILGTVSLLGAPRAEIPIDLGPSCGRLNKRPVTTRHFVVSPEGGLANVLVYLSQGVEGRFFTTSAPPLLNQIGCMFEPYVLAVQTNQKFQVKNSDPEMHNLHFMPRLNRERNVAQPSGGRMLEFSFPEPELFIRLKCDVHPWMFAYISVLEHPFFAVTDTNGVFRLPAGFPAGRYTVTAAHLKAGTVSQEVSIGSGQQKVVDFQLSVPASAQPQSVEAKRE